MLGSSLPNHKRPPTALGRKSRNWMTYVPAVCWVEMGRSLK